MRIFLAWVLVATATVAVTPFRVERQRPDVSEILNSPENIEDGAKYLPAFKCENEIAKVLKDDGYHYKTKEETTSVEYVPPAAQAGAKLEAKASEDSAVLGENGYQYKTVRRIRYRHRRDVSEVANEYLPPTKDNTAAEYVPPAEEVETEETAPTIDAAPLAEDSQDSAVLGDDGYQYKTVRRIRYRHRRDVSEVANEYLPPTKDNTAAEYVPPAEEVETEETAPAADAAPLAEDSQDSAVLGDDGYQYKTVRRIRYRHRRDVSEVANEYLPPTKDNTAAEYVPPAEEVETEETAPAADAAPLAEASQDSAVLGDDGYQYKTVRRIRYRHRRDVSEVANEYLPPTKDNTAAEYVPPAEEVETEETAPAADAAPLAEDSQDSAVLGDDGYQYKTVRRIRYRHRRDVSEVANEYLPPTKDNTAAEYVPPAEEVETEETAPAADAAPLAEASQDSAVLGEDGYQYKTVRRIRYRHRRDVSEVANEYLPPTKDNTAAEYVPPAEEVETEETAPAADAAPLAEDSQDSAVLGDDGYQYKTVRRIRYRHRRDVSEVANEYLPPTKDNTAAEYVPPAEEVETEETAPAADAAPLAEASQDSAVLGEDGYQYKTVRRIRYRHRRDVSEVANEYLPPTKDNTAAEYVPPAEEVETEETAPAADAAPLAEDSQDSAVLGDDGYQYKTVRRIRYRHRRDVSEVANEYLPPTKDNTAAEYVPPAEEVETEETAPAADAAPLAEDSQDSAVLGDDGYQYKTVRRIRYRHRRDVSEVANEYLPPTKDNTAAEYVPPAEEVETEETAPAADAAPLAEDSQDSAVLGDDGYQYKTVRRIRYRHRRDVSEVANEYLPPTKDNTAAEYVPPAEEVETEETAPAADAAPLAEASQDSAVLGEDGYHYKTVRRIRYRHRRDVSEVANEYLPPTKDNTAAEYVPPAEEVETEETAPAADVAPLAEASQDSAVLGEDGYQYKTVRRIRYRHRRDVSEVANEYLPPTKDNTAAEYVPPAEEVETEETAPAADAAPLAEASQDSAVLGEDGYQYKTVRRIRYRHRRDVSEVANEYLPPTKDNTAAEYVPPAEEVETEETAPAADAAPLAEDSQDSAVLGDDGYQYKTVRRIRYRHRRDVSEVANEYLPPTKDNTAAEYVPPTEQAKSEGYKSSAVLGEDGYRYKTIRRLKLKKVKKV